MDKIKIKIIFREIFLFFAVPAAMFIVITGFIFVSFILDSLIRYFSGNYGSSGWIMDLAFIMDRASFYPYLFAYPLFVLLRIECRDKRKLASPESGTLEVEEDPEKARKMKRAIIRESVLFIIFVFLGLLPFLGIYNIFGISLSMSLNLGVLGLLVTALYILYILVRYIIIGVFIRGIIWCMRKLIKRS